MGLIEFYRNLPYKVSPYFFSIEDFKVHYYGLMYVIAYFIAIFLLKKKLAEQNNKPFPFEIAEKLALNSFLGAIIGARIGYVVFYNWEYFKHHLLEIFLPFSFEGGFHITGIAGMSYHGGLIGLLLTVWYLSRKYKLSFIDITDTFAPVVPLGYTFGRIGNFLNRELYGRPTDSILGMYFPTDPLHKLRHPSQLYEATFEGIVLFLILWNISKKNPPKGTLTSLYLIGYGTFRFFIEFFREPDPQLGFVLWKFSMGQILCFFMILLGVIIYWFYNIRTKKEN